MKTLNFIGGEKGGVGKSVVSRVLAQYFIDQQKPIIGFDTDRSHASFKRFYADYAASVVVDRYESLDLIANNFAEDLDPAGDKNVIVDLAAQTAEPLVRWIKDTDLLTLLAEMAVKVNFWHVSDGGKDSANLLGRLLDTYGENYNYVIVRNLGRGSDFSLLDKSDELERAVTLGASVITLPQLHETCMRKIDAQNASFWAAINNRQGTDVLGMLERQRVKTWLKNAYATFDTLPA